MKSKFNNELIKLVYYLSLIPLIIYACYKNGYLLYEKNLGSIFIIVKPLLLSILVMIVSISLDYIINRFIKKRKNMLNYLKNSYNTLFSLLLYLMLPCRINILLIILGVSILEILMNYLDKFKINYVVIVKLLVVIVLSIIGKYTYRNLYEESVLTSYTSIDLFFGRSIGGVGTSNIFLIIISYLILLFIPSYKRYIPINIILSYILMIFIFSIFGLDVRDGLKLMLSNDIAYASVFIATIPFYSPRLYNESILYSIIVGILGFILVNYISLKEGIYIAILISNIIIIILNKLNISIDKN